MEVCSQLIWRNFDYLFNYKFEIILDFGIFLIIKWWSIYYFNFSGFIEKIYQSEQAPHLNAEAPPSGDKSPVGPGRKAPPRPKPPPPRPSPPTSAPGSPNVKREQPKGPKVSIFW